MQDKLKYYLGTEIKMEFQNRIMDLNISDFRFLLERRAKPHMRPLSSLTKPITVEGYNDGELFVPLIKLYEKIGHPTTIKNMEWVGLSVKNFDSAGKEYILKYCDTAVLGINVYNGGNYPLHFTCKRGLCIVNHFTLYELLFSWNFWIFDQSDFSDKLIEITD